MTAAIAVLKMLVEKQCQQPRCRSARSCMHWGRADSDAIRRIGIGGEILDVRGFDYCPQPSP